MVKSAWRVVPHFLHDSPRTFWCKMRWSPHWSPIIDPNPWPIYSLFCCDISKPPTSFMLQRLVDLSFPSSAMTPLRPPAWFFKPRRTGRSNASDRTPVQPRPRERHSVRSLIMDLAKDAVASEDSPECWGSAVLGGGRRSACSGLRGGGAVGR